MSDRNLPVEVATLSDEQLRLLHIAVDREAVRRGLPLGVGDLGEQLVLDLFRVRPDLPVLVPAARGTKNVDALSRDGERYSIKTLLRARKTGTVYPDPIDASRQLFEFLVIVLLSDDLELAQVFRLSWDQFCEARSWDARMNAWYVVRSARGLTQECQIYPSTTAATKAPEARKVSDRRSRPSRLSESAVASSAIGSRDDNETV